jgi:hypothetical protein
MNSMSQQNIVEITKIGRTVRVRVNPDVTLLLPLTYRRSACHHNPELKKKSSGKLKP